MKKAIQKIQAFTLIELIVVIAIIAILATSGTLMLTKRFSSARDSSRKQAVSQISTALDVSMTSRTSFPTPENSIEVYDVSGAIVWYQGVFGPSVADIITAIDAAPQDPSTNEYYGYSISSDKKKYQLKAELENEDTIAYISRAYAADDENKIAYVDGNYNGYILIYTGGKYYLYKLPSIFMKNSGLQAGSKVGSGTLPLVNPGSKFSTDVQVKVADITAVVNSTDSDGQVASGAAAKLGIEVNLISNIIKSAAGGAGVSVGSTFTSTGDDEGGDDTGSTNVVLELYNEGRRWADGTYAVSCNGYINSSAGYVYSGENGDGVYWIDPDGDTTATKVYCDMTRHGGGWTLVKAGIGGTTANADWQNPAGFGTPNATLNNNNYAVSDEVINLVKTQVYRAEYTVNNWADTYYVYADPACKYSTVNICSTDPNTCITACQRWYEDIDLTSALPVNTYNNWAEYHGIADTHSGFAGSYVTMQLTTASYLYAIGTANVGAYYFGTDVGANLRLWVK